MVRRNPKYHNKIIPEKLKTCSICERDKPITDYYPHQSMCKVCSANKLVNCGGCHTRRLEKEMEIYSVPADRYYCNQQCKDRTDGIERKESK